MTSNSLPANTIGKSDFPFDGQSCWPSKKLFTRIFSKNKMNTLSHRLLKLTLKIFFFSFLILGLEAIRSSVPLQAATITTRTQFYVKDQWNIGGTGGWGFLALDAAAHRLYIPRTNRVMVVDSDTGQPVGEVEDMKNIRDVALDDSGKYGYVTDVTDGSAGFVRVFDRSTLKLVASIPTGAVPNAIVFDRSSKSVFVFNSRSHSVSVIDTATNQVATTISLSGRPGSAVGDGNGAVFVALPALGEIVRIDAATKKVVRSWQLAPCTGPSGLAIDSAHQQLFTSCENHSLVSVDAESGHVTTIGQVPAGTGDIDFVPKQNLIFVADINGTLSIFRRESPRLYTKIQQVKTQPGARTMVASPQDSKAYLVTSKYGQNTAATSEELQFRPTPVPGTFSLIVVGR
jgi:YVTN family beta-propeller protein